MRILIVSDAWFPQVNGVVRTLDTLRGGLLGLGHEVEMITPDRFRTLPCPSYPEIRLALTAPGTVGRLIQAAQPCAIHVATEGPLGIAARRHCVKKGVPFTTAYHTRFPEYVETRWGIPLSWTYAFMRWFHGPAATVMVATQSIEDALKARGIGNIRRWSRGVDLEMFRPGPKDFLDLPRPIHLYVGRVAVEKGIEDFLGLDLSGTKLVVGDGPQLEELKRKYPGVRFAGRRSDKELASYYAAADVFVFPSRTDTFGLVLLEALASGIPVAAYPVAGPLDVIDGSGAGVLDEDLGAAIGKALAIPAETCRRRAMEFSWDVCLRQFVGNLEVFA
jgi:glycosyltransferase involved in cell wall biosynthesis